MLQDRVIFAMCTVIARMSPYHVEGTQLDTPERTLCLSIVLRAVIDIASATTKDNTIDNKICAMNFLTGESSEYVLENIDIDKSALHKVLIKGGVMPFVLQNGTKLAETYEHTWEEVEALLLAGRGVLGLGTCIQNIPDFRCTSKGDFRKAKLEWLNDIPRAFQAGKPVRPEVVENWKLHKEGYVKTKDMLDPTIPQPDIVAPQPKFTWSYTALTDFENCPLAYYHKRVLKDVGQDDTEALRDGRVAHKAFEKYLLGQDLFDAEHERIKPFIPVCDTLIKAAEGGELLVEFQMCLTEQLKPTDWYGVDAWGRGVIDVGILKDGVANLFDWKTGKVKDDPTQLKIFCAFLALYYKDIQEFRSKNIYLKDLNAGERIILKRSELVKVWEDILARVHRMHQAWQHDTWQCKTSGLCKAHCPVLTCRHNGRR